MSCVARLPMLVSMAVLRASPPHRKAGRLRSESALSRYKARFSRRLTGSLRCSVSEGSKRRAATVDRGHTHPRRELRSIGGTLSAAWSADGSALSVVDHWASDSARAYIHDAGTLRRLDLGSRILSVDPDAKRFAPRARLFRRGPMGRPTSYIHFQGHTDEAPVVCFDFAIG